MKKVFLFTNIAPHYRTSLWKKLLDENNFEFHFYFGTSIASGIKEINFNNIFFKNSLNKFHPIKNYWFNKRILIWQSGVIITCLKNKFHSAIFLGEVTNLSTWLAVFICKLKGIQVIFWTHGLYGNESKLKKKARLLFYKIADKILLYERRAKNILIKEGFKGNKLKVIFNSLDYDLHLKNRNILNKTNIYSKHFKNNHQTFIFIGRLTELKKLNLIIEAQKKLNAINYLFNIIFIGDGDERNKLEKLVYNFNLQKECWFFGSCYDEDKIGELIFNADLCISPGNVGLTAIHSLSYGTPVCTHNNWYNQMPEVEAIEEDISGCFFLENDVDDLSKSIKKWMNKKESRKDIRNNCYKIIDKYYNPYYQIKILKSIIEE